MSMGRPHRYSRTEHAESFVIFRKEMPQALQDAHQLGSHLSWWLPLWLRRSCPAEWCLLALRTKPFTSDNPIAGSLLAARSIAVFIMHVVL